MLIIRSEAALQATINNRGKCKCVEHKCVLFLGKK